MLKIENEKKKKKSDKYNVENPNYFFKLLITL